MISYIGTFNLCCNVIETAVIPFNVSSIEQIVVYHALIQLGFTIKIATIVIMFL
jgi:hypothetical protein